MERVLNMQSVYLMDGAEMCVYLDSSKNQLLRVKDKYQMVLPLSEASRAIYFGKLSANMTDDLIWALLIGGLYHELGHIISCEPVYTSPLKSKISNIISDANENNVIPNAWFGSVRYLNILNSICPQLDVGDKVVDGSVISQFDILTHMANGYRSDLSILYKKKEVQELPKSHEFYDVFNEIVPIMRRARREWSERPKSMKRHRDKLIKELQSTLEKWYEAKPNEEREGKSLEEQVDDGSGTPSTGDSSKSDFNSMSSKEAKDAAKAMAGAIDDNMKGDMDKAVAGGKYDEASDNKTSEKKSIEDIKKNDVIRGLDSNAALAPQGGDGHSNSGRAPEVPPVHEVRYARPIQDVVHELRSAFRRMIFGRSYKGRKIDIVGRKLHSPNFFQIKTTDTPKLLRDIGKVNTAETKTDIVLMFDRSGSMSGINEQFAKQVMATIYAAIKPIKQMNLNMFGFKEDVSRIADNNNVYINIERYLSNAGCTNFISALRIALRSIEKSTAKRKIVIMLTDGSTRESCGYTLEGLHMHAKRNNIQVIVIDVGSGSALSHREFFDSVVFIRAGKELLEQIKKISRKRF